MQSECSAAPPSTSQSAQELLETLLSITGRVEGFLYRCRNDRDYTMLHISEGVERLCGYPASDFIDNRMRAFSTVILPEDIDTIYAAVDRALAARQNWEIDYRLVHRSGEAVWVHEIGAGVFSGSGELLYLEGFVIDIARRKRMETELSEAQQKLLAASAAIMQSLADREAALATAEAANQAKARFLAIMNHELRTPLNAIIGFSDLIRGETYGPVNNPKYVEYVREINEAGQTLLGIVNSMLELTQLNSGRRTVQIEPLTFEQVQKPALNGFEGALATRALHVDIIPDPGCHMMAGDRSCLVRVLRNVLDNAIKFNRREGTVTLALEHRPDQGKIAITVRDTGTGMQAERLEEIAKPFTQLDGSYTRHANGIGLGLAIAKALLEAMSGSIEIESAPGQGTCVRIVLPEWRDEEWRGEA
jgi:PAS domain S-box-containing protein